MAESNSSESAESPFDPYGMMEAFHLILWGSLSLFFLLKGSNMVDGSRGFAMALGGLAVAVVLPSITFRLGLLPQAIGRFLQGLIVAVFAYETAGIMVANFRVGISYEAEMIAIDEALFGGHASVWLQRFHNRALTEYLQLIYMFYFPQVFVVAAGLIYSRKWNDYYQYVLSMISAFVITHILYIVVPVQSPFLMADAGYFSDVLTYTVPLQGLWFADGLRQSLLEATTIRFDCFPSGHTMHTLVALYFAYRVNRRFGMIMTIIAVSIIFSTLYLRYHYAIDILVGMVLASAVLIFIRPIAARGYAKAKPPHELTLNKPVRL